MSLGSLLVTVFLSRGKRHHTVRCALLDPWITGITWIKVCFRVERQHLANRGRHRLHDSSWKWGFIFIFKRFQAQMNVSNRGDPFVIYCEAISLLLGWKTLLLRLTLWIILILSFMIICKRSMTSMTIMIISWWSQFSSKNQGRFFGIKCSWVRFDLIIFTWHL